MALNLSQPIGPLPLWAWGAGAGVGGLGLIVLARRNGGASSSDSSKTTTAAAGDDGGGVGGVGGFGGGAGSGEPGAGTGTQPAYPGAGGQLPGTGAGATTPGIGTGTTNPAPGPSANPSPRSDTPNRELVTAQPIATIGGGILQSLGRITNPVGYADSEAARPGSIYTPSLLDYATEQPGGVLSTIASGEGRSQGQTTTIYSNPGGGKAGETTGPVMKRISDFPVGEKLTPVAGGYQRVA